MTEEDAIKKVIKEDVIGKESNSATRTRVPSIFLIPLLVFFLFFAYVTIRIEDELPKPIKERDIASDDSRTGSEESAKKYLYEILGDGPRVAGAKYHYTKTKDLKQLVDDIASKSHQRIHTDWQLVDGNFWIAFGTPIVQAYQNLSNIIAVLEGESGFNPDGTTGTSILVNAHYDSVPFSTGASDDGLFCGAMVETLEKLSRRRRKFRHNIIFLINGAEENALQASHGFLSHPWAKNIIGVVNLDSAGKNGRPSVFQVTDPRLLDVYKKTIGRPIAQGLGEFLFTYGIIPSDTDFRIWRDYGKINGLDIAFVKWGNTYHTRNDRPDLIKEGVIQNSVDLLISLVSQLAEEEDIVKQQPASTVVYFDVLGFFLVSYTREFAATVDMVVGVMGVLSVVYFLALFGFKRETFIELIWSTVSHVICLVSGLAVVVALTLLMLNTTQQMRYMSAHWLVVPFYWLPYLVISVGVSHAIDSWRTSKTDYDRPIRTAQAMATNRLIMALVLLLTCCAEETANIRYLLAIPLFAMSIGGVITTSVARCRCLSAWQVLILEVVLHLPATMFAFSLATRLNCLAIPIMGRSASDTPDLIIAGFNAVLVIYVASTVSGIELLFSRKGLTTVLGVVFVVSVGIIFYPFAPYHGDVTQRHYFVHSQVTTYNRNRAPVERFAGTAIVKMDANNIQSALTAIQTSPLFINDRHHVSWDGMDRHINKGLNIRASDLKIIDQECDDYLYCNLPLFRPGFSRLKRGSVFIKMSPPAFFPHSLVLNRRLCNGNQCRLHFTMRGNAHNLISIWPVRGVQLTEWSFNGPVKDSGVVQGRAVYTVVHSTATYSENFAPFEFWVTLEAPPSLQSGVIVEVSHHAHKAFHPEDFTEEYRQLLAIMPDYMNVATFLSFRDNYVF
ncbi:endoplasmic reticulum metallopeptidase 1-like [Bicyclus anynana]|uniref:Endoplasmic reticulum metallopeptidase 1-like n=1 Tax=Bicyclus anynana TaxID=110368 RepID=A0A6J1NP64_BICAN|nr:endoplasmic reticulum metallopeptidase 1-like [Bicyclus anynana]